MVVRGPGGALYPSMTDQEEVMLGGMRDPSINNSTCSSTWSQTVCCNPFSASASCARVDVAWLPRPDHESACQSTCG